MCSLPCHGPLDAARDGAVQRWDLGHGPEAGTGGLLAYTCTHTPGAARTAQEGDVLGRGWRLASQLGCLQVRANGHPGGDVCERLPWQPRDLRQSETPSPPKLLFSQKTRRWEVGRRGPRAELLEASSKEMVPQPDAQAGGPARPQLAADPLTQLGWPTARLCALPGVTPGP